MIKTVTRTPEVKKYVHDVVYLLLHQNVKSFPYQRLRLELYVYPPDNKKRDIDNILKAILDAFQHSGLYADDFHIRQLYVEMREVRKFGEVEFNLIAI